MKDTLFLQAIWEYLLDTFGANALASPGFLLTAVLAGIYVPGILFSIIDVFISKRLTLKQCLSIYWRAMKWYSTVMVIAIVALLIIPLPPLLSIPTEAPTLASFLITIVLYFIVGDFVSYAWHRYEHKQRWYMQHVHYYHHIDAPPLTIWTAMVVNPVEGFSVFLCFHIYGILFDIHPLTFWTAMFLVTAVNMNTHCGYRLPVYDWFFATARGHDIHHSSREPKNISVVLTVCDRLFGTFQKVS